MTLVRKLSVLVIATLVPLVAVIAYNVVHLYDHLQDDAVNETVAVTRLAATSLDRFAHGLIEEGVAVGLAIVEGGMTPSEARGYLGEVGRHVPLSDALFLAPDGELFASSRPVRPETVRELPGLDEVLGGRDAAISRFHIRGHQGLLVLVRVERRGRLEGVAALAVPASALPAVLPPPAEQGGVVLVTDEDGRVAYSQGVNGTRRGSLAGFPPVRRALDGRPFRSEHVSLPGGGKRYVGAQVPVGDTGWTLGYYVPSGVALQHVTDEVVALVAIIGAILLAGQAAVRGYALSIVRPIIRLMEVTGEVAHGRFDTRIDIDTDDEVGQLAEHFRDMQRSLGRTFRDVSLLDEASRRTNASLDIDEVARVAFDYLEKTLGARAVVITLLGEGGRGRPQVFAHGVDAGLAKRLSQEAEEVADFVDVRTRGYAVLDLERIRVPSAPDLPGRPKLLVLLPLIVQGREVGRVDAYAVPAHPREEFERSDVPLAMSFAQQFAVAVTNARLYQLQQAIADTLQDSLLTRPHRMRGLEFGLAYRPATVGARIGGDFYDFVPVDDHRMAVVIGDISGKGIAAARHTAVAKATMRSFTLEDPDPARVLQRSNRVITEQTEAETFITVFYMLLDSRTGEARYVNAGHPSPLLLRGDGKTEPVGGHGVALGVLPESEYEERSVRLAYRERLVAYTDGLSEARRDGELFGEERVTDMVWALRGETPDTMAGRMADRATSFAGGRLQDDLAVMVVARTGVTPRRAS